MAGELRACAAEEAEIQTALRAAGEAVTAVEVAAQRLRDQAQEAMQEAQAVGEICWSSQRRRAPSRRSRWRRSRPRRSPPGWSGCKGDASSSARSIRWRRRSTRRRWRTWRSWRAGAPTLETALRELKAVIRETDKQIEETFAETFAAAARNFEELAGDVFPGGSGRLQLVRDEQAPRAVLGGQPLSAARAEGADGADGDARTRRRRPPRPRLSARRSRPRTDRRSAS